MGETYMWLITQKRGEEDEQTNEWGDRQMKR